MAFLHFWQIVRRHRQWFPDFCRFSASGCTGIPAQFPSDKKTACFLQTVLYPDLFSELSVLSEDSACDRAC